MKQNHVYRVVDAINGFDLTVTAKSVAHAAALGRREIAGMCRLHRRDFVQWQTDNNSGGWKGIYIDLPTCRHVQVPPPNPKPSPRKLPWKRAKVAA